MWPLYKPRFPLVGTGAVSGQPHHRRPGGGMGPPGADEQDRGMSNASSVRRGRYRQAARDAAFLLRLWPILLLAFLVVVPLIALGAGTAVLGVGVPVLVLGLSVSSRFAEIGRRAVADVDSSEYVPGHYRRPGVGEPGVRPLLAPLHDPQRWADLTWVVVGFVVSLATWALAVVWIAVPLAAPLSPFVEAIVQAALGDEQTTNLAELLGLEPDLLWMTLFDVAVCVLFALTCPFVLRALVRAQQAFTRALLCRSGEVARLEASRAAVRRAEADARSRLERDIHDGPQQRVAVGHRVLGGLLGELVGEDVEAGLEGVEVGVRGVDGEVVRCDDPLSGDGLDVVVHGAPDGRRDVDGLDPRPEHAREGAVDAALDGALKAVEDAHWCLLVALRYSVRAGLGVRVAPPRGIV